MPRVPIHYFCEVFVSAIVNALGTECIRVTTFIFTRHVSDGIKFRPCVLKFSSIHKSNPLHVGDAFLLGSGIGCNFGRTLSVNVYCVVIVNIYKLTYLMCPMAIGLLLAA